jgi:predicted PurR-regulated permease PerM
MVGRWLMANIGRFYVLYGMTTEWLEGHGILLAGPLSERFNVLSLVRMFQEVAVRINGLVGFSLMVLIFTMLGLLEVGDFKQKLQALRNGAVAERMLKASVSISGKFRKYLLVRTVASILTGLVVWGFTFALDIELAAAWGVIAFALNYIPVIGPLIATVLPTLFTAAQFESWQMALLVFLGLNVIQFVIGSYLEPRFSGSALAISPFVVVLAVFFWSFLWGIPGAFIGVPVTIAILGACEANPASRWIATLLSGPSRDKT